MIWTILFILMSLVTVVGFVFIFLRGRGLEAAMKFLIANANVLDELAKKTPNTLDDKLVAKAKTILGIVDEPVEEPKNAEE